MGVWVSFVFVIGFVIIHLSSKGMKFLKVEPRSRFLSVAGGIAVAYVFLHLLPELGEYQKELDGKLQNLSFLENHVYIVAMLGLALFYGLEQLAKSSKRHNKKNGEHKATASVFWLHIGSFAIYNATIGYLLLRGEYQTEWGVVFYFIAMGVHFITNDKGLRATHKEDYDRYGRWLLAVSITVGWLVGVFTEVNDMVLSILSAFLAGGIVLNVMKEELPEERESSFPAFFIGMIGYTVLLLLL
ncbi:hypothetical protein HMPREF9372_1189 [Sporosarcina newyorkensis 2681]|uniref:ZIP family zinc (Zn2+)-iron (Fe2+) permease n=1 Tax=Sporosarcina newyorkensis 2681 TaxID=1027292 RepID=F9DQV9_9BACL|nr:hypothetical protein [Sporosarcina newyorkensis]EGQ26798.1 hypothetical protein HMPREF9372_1189 [Sporosarcina newyorkensis 2681]